MDSTKRDARIAGLLYLIVTVTGFFSLMYVPGKLIVRGDAGATAARILASESFFRLGIASNLLAATVFLFVAVALYRLLKPVNQQHATLMALLVFVQVPLTFLNEVSHLAALILVRGADFLSAFDKPQREALAMLFLRLNGQGSVVSEVFWGLWLFPLGILVFRSGILPKFLGVWLVANGLTYIALSFTGVLAPQFGDAAFRIATPFLLGELALMLWLLIMGARPRPIAPDPVKAAAD